MKSVPGNRVPFQVLLYDLERYAGETHAPRYKKGDTRFFLNAFRHPAGELFASLAWVCSALTYEEIRSLVPPGGAYFDRTGNFPSPMVPIEGWAYEQEFPCPDCTHGRTDA